MNMGIGIQNEWLSTEHYIYLSKVKTTTWPYVTQRLSRCPAKDLKKMYLNGHQILVSQPKKIAFYYDPESDLVLGRGDKQ